MLDSKQSHSLSLYIHPCNQFTPLSCPPPQFDLCHKTNHSVSFHTHPITAYHSPAYHLSPTNRSSSSPHSLHLQPLCVEGHGPGLRDADVVIWVGDFNYRLAAPYEWAVARAEAGAFSELLSVDQLRQDLGRGAIFHGMVGVGQCYFLR